MKNSCKILTLQSLKGVGPKAISSLTIQDFNSIVDIQSFMAVLRDKFEGNKRITLPTVEELERLIEYSNKVLENGEAEGIKAITFLDETFPVSLKKIPQPSQMLFVKGDENLLRCKSIAIIGTREISSLGNKVATHFSKYVVDDGWLVTSGLAIGCDTSGHKSCIELGGKTIAVLAGGLDDIYPRQNAGLAQKIIETGGCLVSEYSVGVRVNSYRLVARDRLQSGLASGVMVVETGEKSGTMHAVRNACLENKPIGCCDYDKFAAGHCDNYIHALGNRLLITNGVADGLYDKASIKQFLNNCEEYYALHYGDGNNKGNCINEEIGNIDGGREISLFKDI